MNTTVAPNQSLLDLAIQLYGRADAAVAIAIQNEISITTVPGFTYDIVHEDIPVNNITNYYASRATRPVTQDVKPQQLFENGLFENGLFQ